MERCRDDSYVVNALHCDVWVVCACIVVCTVAFWGSVYIVALQQKALENFLHNLPYIVDRDPTPKKVSQCAPSITYSCILK